MGKYNYNIIPTFRYNAEDKDKNTDVMVRYMLNRTRRMFQWNNLPETIRERELELMLQTNGNVFVSKVNGELYAFTGAPGGKPDAYYMPTTYTVANPYLNYSATLEIGKDGILVPSDSLWLGLGPMLSKYCSLIAENELTMSVINILSRSALVFKADDEREMRSAQEYINKLRDGKLSVISSDKMIGSDGVEVQPGAAESAGNITHLIEMEQYFKAAMWNDLGLNANWNAKRESLTSSETLLNTDTLLPLIDDMLLCRQDAAEKINELFGTDITVDYASAWEDNAEELEMAQEAAENPDSNPKNTDSNPENGGNKDEEKTDN